MKITHYFLPVATYLPAEVLVPHLLRCFVIIDEGCPNSMLRVRIRNGSGSPGSAEVQSTLTYTSALAVWREFPSQPRHL